MLNVIGGKKMSQISILKICFNILTRKYDDAVTVSYEIAPSRVPVNEGLPSDADEEQTFIAGVDQTEHWHRHPEGQQDGRGEAEHHPTTKVAFGTHFRVFIGLCCCNSHFQYF
jgi:hypothetical protein